MLTRGQACPYGFVRPPADKWGHIKLIFYNNNAKPTILTKICTIQPQTQANTHQNMGLDRANFFENSRLCVILIKMSFRNRMNENLSHSHEYYIKKKKTKTRLYIVYGLDERYFFSVNPIFSCYVDMQFAD